MNSVEKQTAVIKLLRAEFQRERDSDFALLRHIPSTVVRKFLDYFSALNEAGRLALSEALAEKALCTFLPGEARNANSVAFQQYRASQLTMWDWKYLDVRMLRGILTTAKRHPEAHIARGVTGNIRKWIEGIKPVKSTEIRKVVKLALSQIILPLKVSHDRGLWKYEGNLQGKAISVNIDYDLTYAQLDYELPRQYQNRESGTVTIDGNYERLMGLTTGGWDCLEQANLDQSIAILKELIVRCAEFYRLLPE